MPTIADIGPYKFFFYSAEGSEPPHVHIRRDRATAKFWLDPVRAARSRRFGDHELRTLQKLVGENRDKSWRLGMSTLVTERDVFAESVRFSDDSMLVHLDDGRAISIPLTWYPRLLHGTPSEREKFELIGDGEGIHWPDLDEDISVEGLLAGRRSAESDASLSRWLETKR